MKYLYEALAKPARLYIKQCPHCGLKYFGKSSRDDIEKYQGSGTRWQRHLKKHSVESVHLWNSDWYYDKSIARFASKFSRINKIVESSSWANLKEEDGLAGGDPGPLGRQKISAKANCTNWKATVGKLSRKKQGNSLSKTMNDPKWLSTAGNDRVAKITETHNNPEWKATVKQKANNQMRQTKLDPEWKNTIGLQRSIKASVKQSETLNNPEWKATVGEYKRMRSSIVQNDPEWKLQKYKTCEHCGKGPMAPGNYKRHHNDNCKHIKKGD